MGTEFQKHHQIISFGKQSFPYSIIRTERTSVGISVESNGEIIVKAPLNLDETRVYQSVNKKRKWIANKIALTTKVIQPAPKIQEPISGEKLRYKNKLYRLKLHLSEKKQAQILLVCKTLHVYVNEKLNTARRKEKINSLFIEWYKQKAQTVITQRVNKYLPFLAVKPKKIQIRETKLRWGTCTEEGSLIFNWRIVMAPISAIDYVVIHELCHLSEANHSAAFWSLVETLQPSYQRWKEWLHVNGLMLDLRW